MLAIFITLNNEYIHRGRLYNGEISENYTPFTLNSVRGFHFTKPDKEPYERDFEIFLGMLGLRP